jgi:RHS repeat-associated protein
MSKGAKVMKALLKTTTVLAAAMFFVAGGVRAETVISVTQYSYDVANQKTCSAVRMNPSVYGSLPTDACTLGTESTANGPDRIVKNTYNAAGELTQVDQAYGTDVQRAYARYWYNSNGTKLYEIDARTYTTQYAYDGFDRLKRIYYPCPTTQSCANGTDYEEYSYDNNDNMTSWRRRDGNVINYGYDNRNRQTTKGGSALADIAMTYDHAGRLKTKVFASSGQGVSYAYDSLGRVSSSTDMNGRTVSYLSSSANARTRMQFPDGNYIDYDRDAASRLKSFGWNANSGLYSRDYNSLGQLMVELKGGGGVSYAYDAIGRLTSFTNNLNGTANDINWSFGYNPSGQLVSNVSSTDVYDYEELSSITEPAQTHDGLNRLTTLVGATGMCPSGGYDARGNLICDGTGRSYTYDIENRLVSGNIGGNSLSLIYDPEGRLASYTWNGGTTSFLYDGVKLIGEYNSSSQMLRRYVHGPGTDNLIVWYEGSGNGTLRYLYTNQQGSVIATADSSGNRGDIYAYGPYGEPKDQYGFTYWPGIGTGSTSVSRFGYTGQVFLADARLYYYKARVYDPQIGRFLQTDPIGSADNLNLYAYVGGDPVNNTDPTGLETHEEFCAAHPGKCDGSDAISDMDLMYAAMRSMTIAGMFGLVPSQNSGGGGWSTGGSEADVVNDPKVASAFDKAWRKSNPDAPNVPRGQPGSQKREQGGWVVSDRRGNLDVRSVPGGTRDSLPAIIGSRPRCDGSSCTVILWYHTHPNNLEHEDYVQGPSYEDQSFTTNYAKVVGVIITRDTYYYIQP